MNKNIWLANTRRPDRAVAGAQVRATFQQLDRATAGDPVCILISNRDALDMFCADAEPRNARRYSVR